MTHRSTPVIVLPGASGGAPDFAIFRADRNDPTRFEKIGYPGWQRCVGEDFSADVLIAELAAQIVASAPDGPVRMIGISIGGHFGYAVALHLQSIGREIAGLCVIDAFAISTAAPTAGWKGRALTRALELLRKRRVSELTTFARAKFWRALIRLAGSRLPRMLRGVVVSRLAASLSAIDSILDEELRMRLLLREVAPWIASLDRDPVALMAPTILLRTQHVAADDAAWRGRCPNAAIHAIPGRHDTLFEAENIDSFRDAFIVATREWR